MSMRSIVLALVFLVCCARFEGQTPADFTFRVSPAQATEPWTDTGLELQSGDTLQISGESSAPAVPDRHVVPGARSCDPKGISGDSTQAGTLPLPGAPVGALIARLHSQGATPLLVGGGTEIHIEEASHLFLAVNVAGTPPCQGDLAVKVHKISGASSEPATSQTAAAPSSQPAAVPVTSAETPAGSPEAKAAESQPVAPSSTAEAQPKSRGEELKSQLKSAAQIFMSGQFGIGKSESSTSGAATGASSGSSSNAETTSAAPVLKLSDAALDGDLRKQLDTLPRRVNDQFKNLGDMVNFVIVGNQKDVQAALDAATWHVADTTNEGAVLAAIRETMNNRDYLQMPMSTLFLYGRKQDFGYEMAEPIAMVASRHHFRIWKAPFTWKGSEVWVGAGTHDTGFAKDKRNGSVTHKIDPAVDGERDNIGGSLQKANKTKTMTYYMPSNPVQEARNATGDSYHSDGKLLVIFLQ